MFTLRPDFARLHSGAPWWLVRAGIAIPPETARRRADIAIVGAGITGALLADALSAQGLEVLVIDRREPATGSSAVSTGLLQYELDLDLGELIDRIGAADAVAAWQASDQALDHLTRIVASLNEDVGFAMQPSLYLASKRSHRKRVEREGALRLGQGFDCMTMNAAQVESAYGIASHGGLWTRRAGVIDPVRFTLALLRRAVSRATEILARTTVNAVEPAGDGVVLTTTRGTVHADQVILAPGYEVPEYLMSKRLALHSTYAIITEPLDKLPFADGCLLWESARPYHYLRATDDSRLIVGGEDVPFTLPTARDLLLPGKAARLEQYLDSLLPELHAVLAHSWTGTFGVTDDSLPIIGPVPGQARVYQALGYGGNGITFGVVAAQILQELCLGRDHPAARLFRSDRP